jgi:hypothetical protein
VVKQTLRELQGHTDFQWRDVNIDSDSELQRMYNDEVPSSSSTGAKPPARAGTLGGHAVFEGARK